ncbi:MAG TPA: hypothetical protein PKA37_03545 [Planctomycetota bacterium]|nr:hypothetical protein [Planctomycetota bacterium]
MTQGSSSHLLAYHVGAGGINMATDDVLLECGPTPLLRFYGWSEPTLSLGHFQGLRGPPFVLPEKPQSVVRRMTGGGAILHDQELTYSVILEETHPLLHGLETQASYAVLHEPIIRALRLLGIDAAPGTAPSAGGESTFYCFERITPMDLRVGNLKLVGSAQRRKAGRVLQHGSILLASSPVPAGATTVEREVRRGIPPQVLAELITQEFRPLFSPLLPYAVPAEIRDRILNRVPDFVVR